jgi:CBS domain-containing protein
MEIRELVARDLVTVGPTHTLVHAATAMHARKVGAAIVVTDEGPGIISERDVLRAVADGADLGTATVADYMTWNAIVATSAWDTETAARTMLEGGFRHLVVMDGVEEIGILSIRDLMAGLLPAPAEPTV